MGELKYPGRILLVLNDDWKTSSQIRSEAEKLGIQTSKGPKLPELELLEKQGKVEKRLHKGGTVFEYRRA